ncbi:MAG: peptide-methionine (R)-S-oxide reductase, partial [Gammaproteobacteria bacterium]|nr:peptide-methionine (R)-S-oxide reductase [Gammaproteobacteria bacterium]
RACGEPLFESDKKFDAGCGWPSFDRPMENTALEEIRDTSHGMIRTEVRSTHGDSHLGHVFEGEGFSPKNIRHCVNSISMKFAPAE